MKIAIYGDAHITRKMGHFQNHWEDSVLTTFLEIYQYFKKEEVDLAICLGDFFDKSVLEAKSVNLVTHVLSIMEVADFKTHILLGNHEIDSHDHNILDFLQGYDNISPITELATFDNLTFIPYSVPLDEVPSEYLRERYVFTHHDIYGSELAGGKVKASFGTHPEIFKEAHYVFNGHVHLSSKLGNIFNIGSILKMQQGELRVGELPQFMILDTDSRYYRTHYLRENLILPLTVNASEIDDVLSMYHKSNRFLLRVTYEGEPPNLNKYKKDERILSISLKRSIGDSVGDNNVEIKKSNLDIKEFLSNYIKSDSSLPESLKSKVLPLGLSLLGE